MPIILPHGLTSEEIRVLQEYRRLNSETLALDVIKAIKHPADSVETPAVTLLKKGFLQTNGTEGSLALTQKAKEFLAIEAVPHVEESSHATSAAENGLAAGE